MIVCRKCGWEIKQDFGLWTDMYQGVVCDWNGDVPQEHEPRHKEVRTTPNKPHLAVA